MPAASTASTELTRGRAREKAIKSAKSIGESPVLEVHSTLKEFDDSKQSASTTRTENKAQHQASFIASQIGESPAQAESTHPVVSPQQELQHVKQTSSKDFKTAVAQGVPISSGEQIDSQTATDFKDNEEMLQRTANLNQEANMRGLRTEYKALQEGVNLHTHHIHLSFGSIWILS